jgi:hypothetical protein
MQFKRYIYPDLDLLVPVKCGTRWIEQNTNPISITEAIHHKVLRKETTLTPNTIMLYRNPIEHMESAFWTETCYGKDGIEGYTTDIVERFISDYAIHYSPNMWREVYRSWNMYRFQLLPFTELSNLFPGIEHNKSDWGFGKNKDKKKTISKIPKTLYTLTMEDYKWKDKIGTITNVDFMEYEDAIKRIDELIINNNKLIVNNNQLITRVSELKKALRPYKLI